MKITMEEKKVEALKRMDKLGYWKRAREAFRRSGKIFVNEPPFGGLYDLEPELEEAVKKFEEKNDALVYMVVRSFTRYGTMDSLLYVCDWQEEWGLENAELSDGIVFSYTINHDDPHGSEFGSIGIRRASGAGMVRVA